MRTDGSIRSATDADDAAWIAQSIRPFETYSVGSIVPPVFSAYARILHPARARDGSAVRWQAIAAWSGGSVHALAQLVPMARDRGRSVAAPPLQGPPLIGVVEPTTLTALCAVLGRHTTTPTDCQFGVWDGWAWITRAMNRAARLGVPQRGYLLFRGPLDGIGEIGSEWPHGGSNQESPNIFWPADRSWFVATEVDLDSTFVGGSTELISELLDDKRLEVWPAAPTDRVTFDSDPINGI